jgi:trehalose 6-phosphate synthase/phosphatase
MAEGQYCRVHLRVRAQTSIGQTVAVGGSCKAMGNFNKNRVIHLVTTPDSYPVWYTQKPIILPRFQVAQYKYCTVEGGIVRAFERVDAIRTLRPDDSDTYIEDIFNPLRLEGTAGLDSEENLLMEMQRLTGQHNSAGAGNDLDGSIHSFSVLNQMKKETQKLWITCYHLPVNINRTTIGNDNDTPFTAEWADSLIAKTDNSISLFTDVNWIGTCKVPDPQPTEEEQKQLVILLGSMNCHAIFLDDEVAALAYEGYCKHIMWPIFHNVDQLDQIHSAWNVSGNSGVSDTFLPRVRTKSQDGSIPTQASKLADEQELKWTKNENSYYEAYNQMSSIFAQKVVELIQPGDVVWVHDYHLMLLPRMIREQNIDRLRIIYFLHIPFPTSQIFRSLACATDLLQSLTCADIIGFHAFDHTRHFLNATKRILGIRSHTLQGGLLALEMPEREAIVTMSHVSIESTVLDRVLMGPEVHEAAKRIKDSHPNRRILVGIDSCNRLSGGVLKLAALDKLLGDYGSNSGKFVLIQCSLRPGTRKGDEETTSSDMRKMVEELNLRYNTEGDDVVVDYQEMPHMSLSERVALYLAADVFVLTSIREGLNLMPLEYIYSRKDLDHAGVVVASEFSTCSSLLSGSLRVNPFYTLSVADALDKALKMGKKECDARRLRDIQFIKSHPSSKWTKQIIDDLKHIDVSKNKKKSNRASNIPEPLDIEYILDAYETAGDAGLSEKGRRVFIFDYGGTLLPKEKIEIYMKTAVSSSTGRKPTETMLNNIRILSEDSRNQVIIITGLTRTKLGDTFKGYKNVTLVTSNGFMYSWGAGMLNSDDRITNSWGKNENDDHNITINERLIDDEGRVWQQFDFNIDWQAVGDIAVPIIEKYTFRTNGSCMSPRVSGIAWNYFGADPDWGEKQAVLLQLDLEAALANYDVKILSQIQGSIEIVPTGLTKGVMVEEFFKKLLSFRAGLVPAFAFVAGDEDSDDCMFDVFYELLNNSQNASVQTIRGFTVSVGKRPGTSATLYANDVNHIEKVLTSLANIHAEENDSH